MSANALRLRLSSSTVYAKQICASAQPCFARTLRVLFVCYVRYARCPQMLCACVSLRLRSVGLPSSARTACGYEISNHGRKKKDIRSNVFSLVTLPRFVGRRANDCRNSGASKFTCIATRQSGYRVRHARRADMKYPTSVGKRKRHSFECLFFGDPTEVRTRVTAVKGRCLRPLDHRAVYSICISWWKLQDSNL